MIAATIQIHPGRETVLFVSIFVALIVLLGGLLWRNSNFGNHNPHEKE